MIWLVIDLHDLIGPWFTRFDWSIYLDFFCIRFRQPTPFDRLCYSCPGENDPRTTFPPSDNPQHPPTASQESSERHDTCVHSPDVSEAGGLSLEGQQRTCMGSRVFGDCDVLMREILSLLLTTDELREWHNGAEARSLDYSRQRKSVREEGASVEYNSRF